MPKPVRAIDHQKLISEYIKTLVDNAPPLSNEQLYKLRLIFKGAKENEQNNNI